MLDANVGVDAEGDSFAGWVFAKNEHQFCEINKCVNSFVVSFDTISNCISDYKKKIKANVLAEN